MTADATRLCLDRGITVAWLGRDGRLNGRLVPRLSGTAEVRLSQYLLAQNGDASLDLSRVFISAKLRNGAAHLSALRSNRPGRPALGRAIRYLREASARAARADSKEVLLGIEGDAAKNYFAGLAECFEGEIAFQTRLRRPPPDPANALLSFGYVLLASRMAGLLEARGLDPYVGFLHAMRSGRPSLALDLIEELRHPVVDRFTVRLCNRRQLRPEHFEADEERPGGVRLGQQGMRRFLAAWEEFIYSPVPGDRRHRSGQDLLSSSADRMAAQVRHGDAYAPYLLAEVP